MENFIQNWLRQDVLDIDAYYVQLANNFIKLDAMENPYRLPDKLAQQHNQYLKEVSLNRYPDPEANQLKQALKTHMQIADDYDILLGNGSDELIQLLALACSPNEVIMSPNPSFVMYEMIAKFTHLKHITLPLNKQFDLEIDVCLNLIQTHQPKLIFLAYPNNPTANCFNKESIKKIIQSTNALVVLDEAYYAYTNKSFIGELSVFNNLVVMRTISKIGLAGLRLGLLIGTKPTITQLNKLRLPYNINALSQASAYFFLTHFESLLQQTQTIIAQRKQLIQALNTLNTINAYPSETNFILFKAENSRQLFNYLLENNILIKNLCKHPKLADCLRVSIGTESENQLFLQTVSDFYD